jgi:hypothetical protein
MHHAEYRGAKKLYLLLMTTLAFSHISSVTFNLGGGDRSTRIVKVWPESGPNNDTLRLTFINAAASASVSTWKT